MINNIEEIKIKIADISSTLNGMRYIPLDKSKISKARSDIFDLLEATVHHLHNSAALTPWQTGHIVDTINSLYWNWLDRALTSIKLTIADPNTISPNIVYKQEIVNLNFTDLEKQIVLLKKFLTDNR